jgi:flagellar basal-body rod protein FlgG
MDPSLRTAATGMQAQQTRIEVISNNLANVNTTAFKRSRAQFEDLLYQTVQGQQQVQLDGAQTLEAIQVGRGTRLSSVQRVDMQGPLEQTGRRLDLAIEGDGLFQVRMPDGTQAYTRDGSFVISDQGTVTTHSGFTVEPGINIPNDIMDLTISASGVVSGQVTGGTDSTEIGRIQLVRFTNTAGLESMGQNLYKRSVVAGDPVDGFPMDAGFGRVIQGSLEGSNVEVVQEMVDMITALRAYEINSRSVQNSDQMAEMANNMGR